MSQCRFNDFIYCFAIPDMPTVFLHSIYGERNAVLVSDRFIDLRGLDLEDGNYTSLLVMLYWWVGVNGRLLMDDSTNGSVIDKSLPPNQDRLGSSIWANSLLRTFPSFVLALKVKSTLLCTWCSNPEVIYTWPIRTHDWGFCSSGLSPGPL